MAAAARRARPRRKSWACGAPTCRPAAARPCCSRRSSSRAWGWRGLWVALSAVAAVCFVLVARHAPTPRYGGVGSLKLALESLAQPGSLALALLFAFYVAQWTSVMIWLPTFLVDERGASTAIAVAAHGAHGAGQRAGQPRRRLAARARRAPRAADPRRQRGDGRDRHRDVEQRAAGRAALPRRADVLLLRRRDPRLRSSPASSVHAKTPQHVGTTNGMVMQTSQAGQFFGPIVLAWLASHFGGWGASLWAMLAFAACGALCGFAVLRIERARRARIPPPGGRHATSPHLRSRPARRAAERPAPDAHRGEEGLDQRPRRGRPRRRSRSARSCRRS